MAASKKCQECGTELPENAPEGLCPKCLMRVAMGESRVGATLSNPIKIDGPGTTIGRYELLELIGEGGMGMVYLAEQKEPVRRKVALKIIKPGMDSRQVVARFEAERQTLALLDHPNIAHVFDAGCTETGRPYFVMEHVKGRPITRYCDENKLTIEQRLRLFEQVCETIHHAHQKGIIHRDLKPSNILVSVHGDRAIPKIIDFGIAKAITAPLTDKTAVTLQGQLLGTPEYMSPEQVDLAMQDIDTRSDIYSLGVVLYELLAGVLPFEKESLARAGWAEIQQTIREQEPASPSLRLTSLGERAKTIAASRGTQVLPLARRLHRELEWIPLKAMRKDRCRRYRSAAEIADDLRNYLNGLPLLAGPETTVYRVQKFVRKHAGAATAVAVVALAIILGFGTSTTMYARAEGARQEEATAREVAEKAEKAANDKAEELRRILYVSSIQLADAKYGEGDVGRVRSLLDSCPVEFRGWEWNRLNYVSDQSDTTLRGHEQDGIWSLALSPNGQQLASAAGDGTVRLWDWQAGTELKVLRPTGSRWNFAVAFSPDGRHLAAAGAKGIVWIWDAITGEEIRTLRGQQDWIRSVAFSPDGKLAASGGRDQSIKVWDVSKGEEVATLPVRRGEIHSVAFDPRGKHIASGNHDKTIAIWDFASGREVAVLAGHRAEVMSIVYAPDGKSLASASHDGTIRLWNTITSQGLTTLRGHAKFVLCVAYDPSGKYLVSASVNTVRIWDAVTGEELTSLRGHQDMIHSTLFSPDGKKIISAGRDKTIKIWDIDRAKEQIVRQISPAIVYHVEYSPDGRRIAAGTNEGTIKMWDAESGMELVTVHGHEGRVNNVAFSPDGRRMASGGTDKTIRIWDTATQAATLVLQSGHSARVATLAFSPDSRRIASGGGGPDGTVRIWDAENGKEMMTLRSEPAWAMDISFSPGGRRLACGRSDGTVQIWDTASGREMMILEGHNDWTRSVVYTPDGARIISAGRDGVMKVWDAETGKELKALLGHIGLVSSICLSSDGKRLFSGSTYDGVKVWDTGTWSELVRLDAPIVYSVAFNSRTGRLVAGGYDGVLTWEAVPPAKGSGQDRLLQQERK
jgi:WD40 repeat protein